MCRATASLSNIATLAGVVKNFIRGAKISDYLLSLTAMTKARYLNKLSMLGLKETTIPTLHTTVPSS